MIDYKTKLYTPFDKLTAIQTDEVVSFLHTHLQEFGDEEKDIRKAISYAMKEVSSPGGFVLTETIDDQLAGAVVVNKTGMQGYIPENILVYVAVHQDHRGKGLGKKLMKNALKNCKGDVALHVESDNPAKFLYEKIGFTNKYLEMRYKNTQVEH